MVEVMIALLLTAIAVIGIMALYSVETRSSSFTRRNTEASVMAEDKMEWLRTQVAPASATDTVTEPTGALVFNRSWNVTPNTNWIDYQVTVSWTEDDGSTRQVLLRSKRGL